MEQAANNDLMMEICVTVKVKQPHSGELREVVATQCRVTKADAGKDKSVHDDWVQISIEPGKEPGYADPKVVVNSHLKLTGRMQELITRLNDNQKQ